MANNQEDAKSGKSNRTMRRVLWAMVILLLMGLSVYLPSSLYFLNNMPEELTPYDIPKREKDDTLRILIIGDSWAEYHSNLEGDTIIDVMAKKMYRRPLKGKTRGKGFATSKDIYFYMFANKTEEHSYEPDRCTQPLIEEHPDYCVIYAGINDAILRHPSYFYTNNIRFIIELLLHNGIRPVVMEMPLFKQINGISWRPFMERTSVRLRGYAMGTWWNDVPFYRKKLKQMLSETGLKDSVLYIPADKWNKTGYREENIYVEDGVHLNLDGYHRLDSCIVSEITKDYISKTKEP